MNKHLLIALLMMFAFTPVMAQDEVYTDSVTEYTDYSSDTTVYSDESYETEAGDFQAWYHFSDTDQLHYNQSKIIPALDSAYWKQLVKQLNFEEDTLVKEKQDTAVHKPKTSGSSFNPGDFKFLFIALALVLLGIIIFYLIRNSDPNNKKVKDSILINLNELDEQSLKEAELKSPLARALAEGDYQTAYRLRYLQVLQALIAKNLIQYAKEKTNYQYLMQLSGQNVYEPFRMLTFNFDGIWYGELPIDAKRYNELEPYFKNFEASLAAQS